MIMIMISMIIILSLLLLKIFIITITMIIFIIISLLAVGIPTRRLLELRLLAFENLMGMWVFAHVPSSILRAI